MNQVTSVSRGTKTLVALTIVAWGAAAAFVFHRVTPTRDPPGQGSPEKRVARTEAEIGPTEPAAPPLPVVRLQTSAPPPPQPAPIVSRAVTLNTLDPGDPPPRLARSFPEFNATLASRWGAMFGLSPVNRGQAGKQGQTHKVVDLDTLRSLSRRYLGTPDRFMEIYEANRDVLPNPEVLPIGVELKIPTRQQEPRPTLTPDGPLVSVPPRKTSTAP